MPRFLLDIFGFAVFQTKGIMVSVNSRLKAEPHLAANDPLGSGHIGIVQLKAAASGNNSGNDSSGNTGGGKGKGE